MTGSRLIHWILCCLMAATVGVAGCSSDTTTSGESTGSLGLSLELAPGVVINEVRWLITRPGMVDMDGTIDTSAPGATASVEVFGLLPGDGYTVTLTAMAEGEDTPCIGSADFSVEVGVSTPVMVMLNCKRPERLGGVRVNGKFNVCADLAKVIVSPLQTSVGNDIDLSALAVDVDDDQDAIRYRWIATGGSIADPTDRITTYTCEEVGEHTILIRVSDDPGEFGEFCMDDWTVNVTCVEGDGDLCEDNICDENDTECSNSACNPLNGECFDTPINEGGSCDGGEGTCMNGNCIVVDLCEGNTCDEDDTECNNSACNPLNGQCFDTPINEGGTCEDIGVCMSGDCIISDLCEGNTCDENDTECNNSACNPLNGECFDTPINEGQLCDGGVCMSGDCVDLCDGNTCDDNDTECSNSACNPLNGECFDTPINEGGSCDGGEGTCMNGNCIVVDLCEGNTCDDNDTECNNSSCNPLNGECFDTPINDGELCEGGTGTCMSGTCVDMCEGNTCDDNDTECNDSSCNSLTGQCEDSPINEGGACAGGTCMSGNCIPSATDPCQDTPLVDCTKVINVGCGNNVTPDVSILPYALTVDPTPILASSGFTADLGGVAEFSEEFLDAAQGAVPGGVTAASLVDLVATVQTRGAGATGANVPLGGGAAIPFICVYSSGSCDPANNGASVPGFQPNSDCIPMGKFNPCGQVVEIPTSADCAPGGVCDGLDKLSQCTANGFCVTGGLPLPLDPVLGASYTAGDGVTAGQTTALFGWFDMPADDSPGVDSPPVVGGIYNIVQPSYTGVAGPVGLAVNASGLGVQLECVMAEPGGADDDGDTLPDEAIPSPDSSLLSFPVEVP